MGFSLSIFRRSVLLGAGFFALLSGFALGHKQFEISYHISEKDLTSGLRDRLPFSRQDGPITATVTQADISLYQNEGFQIRMVSDFKGSGISGTALIDSKLQVKLQKGKIYARDVDLGKVAMSMDKVDLGMTPFDPEIWETARSDILKGPADPVDLMTSMKMKIIEAATPTLMQKIEDRLEARPLVDFNSEGLKGWVAKEILSDIEVNNGYLTLKLWVINKITRHALIIFGILCFASVLYRWRMEKRRDGGARI
jgi:hypothetical protein